VNGEFHDLRLVLCFCLSQVLDEFLDLCLVSRFCLNQVAGEFLDLSLVLRFGLRKMSAEFLKATFELISFLFVANFRLRQELAVKLLDLRHPFRDERIQPAD